MPKKAVSKRARDSDSDSSSSSSSSDSDSDSSSSSSSSSSCNTTPVQTPQKKSNTPSPKKKAVSSSPSKNNKKVARAEEDDSVSAAKTNDSVKAEAKALSKKESSSGSGGGKITKEQVEQGTVPYVRTKSKDADFNPAEHVKIVSWNVAGLRAVLNKGGDLQKLVDEERPDLLCLQETKMSETKGLDKLGALKGYSHVDTISTAKKGYSGCRTYVRAGITGVSHRYSFDVKKGADVHDNEGRVISTTFSTGSDTLTVVNSYVPNSGLKLDRLDYRVGTYDPMVRNFLKSLNVGDAATRDRVVWTGDLNVAERDYDRFFQESGGFKAMEKCPGFHPRERTSFRTTLTEAKLVDGFRHLYPNARQAYTFYSARFGAKAKGNGWRLDYFCPSAALAAKLVDVYMKTAYASSDHLPVVMVMKRK